MNTETHFLHGIGPGSLSQSCSWTLSDLFSWRLLFYFSLFHLVKEKFRSLQETWLSRYSANVPFGDVFYTWACKCYFLVVSSFSFRIFVLEYKWRIVLQIIPPYSHSECFFFLNFVSKMHFIFRYKLSPCSFHMFLHCSLRHVIAVLLNPKFSCCEFVLRT